MPDPLKLYWFFGLLQSSYSLAELYQFFCLLTGLASPPPSTADPSTSLLFSSLPILKLLPLCHKNLSQPLKMLAISNAISIIKKITIVRNAI